MIALPAVRETDTIAPLSSYDVADIVLFMGAQDMVGAPQQEVTLDEDGSILSTESEHDYIKRVWKELGYAQRSEMVYLGLQKASGLRENLTDGIQLVVFRAHDQGWWVPTAGDAIDDNDKAFRAWVKETTVPEGASTSEATQLASTILNLTWLRDNCYGGLPVNEKTGEIDLESIFADRTTYNRWRRVASPLRQLIQGMADTEDSDDLEQQIKDLVDMVNDPEKGVEDLDSARANPRIPEAIIRIVNRDVVGRHEINALLTDSQLHLIRTKLKGTARFLLKGETSSAKELVLVEYRLTPGEWNRRTWSPGTGWSEWQECEDKPDMRGMPDGVPLVDEDLAVEYHRYWEETE